MSMSSMARRMRAQRGSAVQEQQYNGYAGTRGNYGPNEVTGVMGGSWSVPDAPRNGFGCPVGWTGYGDQNPFQFDLLPGGINGEPVATEGILQAAFDAAARYVIIRANVLIANDVPGAPPVLGPPIPANTVFLASARTANGPDALFNSGNAAGCDVTYFDPLAFAPRDVNWPSYFNQPGLSLSFVNTIPAAGLPNLPTPITDNVGVRLRGCAWVEQAHMGQPNLGG